MDFSQLLSRADDEVLQELIGAPVVRVLRYIDPELAVPRRLRELLLELNEPSELLRDASSRKLLLELLPEETAKTLVEHLQAQSNGGPFDTLLGMQINKGTILEERLFSFFGETIPPEAPVTLSPERVSTDVEYGMFKHQRVAAAEVHEILSSDRRKILLHMPTGSGKTRTAMHIIADHLRNAEPTLVVWLAYSDELCEQAAAEFSEAWTHLGNRNLEVYRFWGAREIELENLNDGFLVAGLGKTYSHAMRTNGFLPRLGDKCSLVIIDEAHQAIANTYNLILDSLVEKRPTTGLLGLSATPGRTWNEIDQDQRLADFFYRQKVTLKIGGHRDPIDYLIEEGYLAKPSFDPLFYNPGYELSKQDYLDLERSLDITPRVLRVLAEDEQRNLAIVHRIEQLIEKHNRVIVFAASVSHARLLSVVLRGRGVTADAITAESQVHDRVRVINRFRGSYPEPVVLCNYGVLTAGFDAPNTSAAVIARPTKSLVLYSQMVGRALRGPRAGGNAEAQIVTVVDTNLPGFRDLAESFFNWEDVWT